MRWAARPSRSASVVTDATFVAADRWIGSLLDHHAPEIDRRGLQVRRELDAELALRRTPAAERTLEQLLRFAFSTVPDGCEVFVAATRAASPVAAVGQGELVLRWQVVGRRAPGAAANVRPIRPVPGGASVHLRSGAAGELRAACAALDWILELSSANHDRELWMRVGLR